MKSVAFLILFGTFYVYLATLTPTIPFHDSGDMITASWLLGIPHPTGYPLYSLFGKVWTTLVPIGNIAYRMNAESAIFASFTVTMVYLISHKIAMGHLFLRFTSSAVASLILGFSHRFWEQAVIAEKYTLNALFFTFLIFILLKWQESGSKRCIYLFCFLLGLSFCHHMQTVFVIPAAVFFIIVNAKKLKLGNLWLKTLSKILLLFALPLTLYLYLPIRSAAHPQINWGDPDRLNGFIDYITAKGYAHYFEKSSLTDHIKRGFEHWKTHIPQQFGILFLPAICGLFLLGIKRWKVFYLFLLVILANTAHCSHYNIPNVWDYYFPTYIILSIGFGTACWYPLSFTKNRLILLLSSILLLIPYLPLSKNVKSQNKSRNYQYYDEGMGYLISPEKGAVLLTKGDICFILWYLHYVENVREDLFLINGTFLHTHWLMDEIGKKKPGLAFDKSLPEERVSSLELANIRFEKYREIMANNWKKYPIYTPFSDEITEGFTLIPECFFNRVVKDLPAEEVVRMAKSVRVDVGVYQRRTERLKRRMKDAYVRQGVLFSEIRRSFEAINAFKKAKQIDPDDEEVLVNLSKCYYNLALEFDRKEREEMAERYYKEAIRENPEMVDAHYNLGLLYHRKGDSKKTIHHWKKAVEIDPARIKTRENIATVYYNSGDYRNAYNECEKILARDPQNTLANNMVRAIRAIAPDLD